VAQRGDIRRSSRIIRAARVVQIYLAHRSDVPQGKDQSGVPQLILSSLPPGE
jgi:hypothetical protein